MSTSASKPQSTPRIKLRGNGKSVSIIKSNLGNNSTGPKRGRGNPRWKKGMPPTNPRGRPKGAKNKIPSMIRMAMESGELPLAFMLRMMRDTHRSPEFRLQAASAAAPYVHKKMPIGIEQIPGRYGSLTADQLRQLPTPALQQLLAASQAFYQQLIQLGIAQPQGEVIDVSPV